MAFKKQLQLTASKSLTDPNLLQKHLNSDKTVRMTQAQKGQTPFANPWEWLAHPKTSLWYPMTHKMRPNKRNLTKWFGESETKAEHFRPESWAQFGPPFTLTHLECTQTVVILTLGGIVRKWVRRSYVKINNGNVKHLWITHNISGLSSELQLRRHSLKHGKTTEDLKIYIRSINFV